MFISPAYAQTGGGAGGGLEALLPLVLIFVVFYFLLIRPQQKKMKDHKAMLAEIRRGDKVVTGGGIMGTVSKIDDEQIVTVEIAKDVKVKVRRELVSAVLNKTAAVSGAANDTGQRSGGLLSTFSSFFGGSKTAAAPTSAANDADVEQTADEAPKKRVRKPRAKKKTAASPASVPDAGSTPASDAETGEAAPTTNAESTDAAADDKPVEDNK